RNGRSCIGLDRRGASVCTPRVAAVAGSSSERAKLRGESASVPLRRGVDRLLQRRRVPITRKQTVVAPEKPPGGVLPRVPSGHPDEWGASPRLAGESGGGGRGRRARATPWRK